MGEKEREKEREREKELLENAFKALLGGLVGSVALISSEMKEVFFLLLILIFIYHFIIIT